jgi:hypothetical protein
VSTLPAISCGIVGAEPLMQEPMMPTAQPPTMNHFLPKRSLSEPYTRNQISKK